MITSNQQFPYTEESITLKFSPHETAARVVQYLAINGMPASVVSATNGAAVAHPEQFEGDMLIKWNVPKLDADGNQVTAIVDGVSVPQYHTITCEWWKNSTANVDLNIPVGAVLTSLDWLEPELQAIPIRWVTNKGQKYFPITHANAVIDNQGNKISTVIEWCRESIDDYQERMDSMERKLLKEVTTYGTLSTTGVTADANGYKASDLLSLFLDDTLSIPVDASTDGRKVTLVKEDGTVIGQYTLPLDYTAEEDASFYIYTDSELTTGLNYTAVTLASRGGGGSDIAFIESNSILTINDNDNAKSYQVARANTLVKADNTTITAVTSADGVSKTISVSDDLRGVIYDKTTGSLTHKSLANSNSPVGRNSVAFGDNSKTLNASETALGQYNTSHDNGDADAKSVFYGDAEHTAFSVGIGLTAANRFNAVEVMQNGDVYIKGVGGYDGKSITAAGLQTLQAVLQTLAANTSGIDVSSVFDATTPTLPASYTLAQLQGKVLYAMDADGNRYDVTLKYDASKPAGQQGTFFYLDFDGTNAVIVKSVL